MIEGEQMAITKKQHAQPKPATFSVRSAAAEVTASASMQEAHTAIEEARWSPWLIHREQTRCIKK